MDSWQRDEQLRRAIRAELQGNNPNTAIFREFAASRVSLAPDAVAKAEAMEGSTVEMETPASTPAVTARPPRRQRPATARAITSSGALDGVRWLRRRPLRANPQNGPHLRQPMAAAPVPQLADRAPRTAAVARRPRPHRPLHPPRRVRRAAAVATAAAHSPPAAAPCSVHIAGRILTVQRCPACATELDVSWKFCITCGRGVAAT